MQIPIWLYCPGSHGRHWVCESSGCVPDGQAEHETPSTPISLSPHGSQKVEKSANVHLLPASHGFLRQSATDAPPDICTGTPPDESPVKEVLRIATVSAATEFSELPCGA